MSQLHFVRHLSRFILNKMYLNLISLCLLSIPCIESAGLIRTLIIESAGPCPNQNKIPTRLKNITVFNSHGKAVVSFEGEVTEVLKAPLEIRVEGERCDLQKTKCSQAPGVNFPDLCMVTDSMYAQMIFTKMEPPITKCPVPKVGLHTQNSNQTGTIPRTYPRDRLPGLFKYGVQF